MNTPPPPPDRSTLFIELLGAHERGLTHYVHSLIFNRPAAEDVLQETRLTLWRIVDRFELGTNFSAWARKVAFRQVLQHRRRQKREHEPLSDEFLEMVAAEMEPERTDERSEALQKCLVKLTPVHRGILLLRYHEDLEIDAIASKVGRTDTAVYRVLSRTRFALLKCVNDELETVQPS